jgi:HPt (histidine-containing phosphotransfer) domain-containing protein
MHSEQNGQAIDLNIVMAHVDGDLELLKELSAMFLEDYPDILDELKESIRHRDFSTLERLAHTLKGRLAFFGIQNGTAQVRELEHLGGTHNLSGAWEALAEMETALAGVLSEIQKLFLVQSE